MASTDARPVARKNTAFRITFPLLDADGDIITGATGLDSEISKDGGTFVDCTNEATEIATASGIYFLDLTSTECNADCVAIIVKTSSVGGKTTVLVLYPEEVGDYRADVVQWLGTAAATPTVAGVPEIDVTHWNGTAVATPDTVGFPKVTIKDGTGTGELDTLSGAVLLQPGAITAAVFAAGAIDAAAIANNAIDAATLATDVAAKIRSLITGTADSGSTSTMVDAALTQADTDYWKGAWLVFTSGTLLGQVRLITGFNAATDTITFTPVTTQAVTTHTYEILPAGAVDLRLWAGTAPNGLVSGRVDSSTGAMAANTLDAAALAADAVTEIQSGLATAANLATALTNIDALPTNAELATALGTADDAVLAAIAALNNLSAAAVNAEIVDALSVDTYAELAQQAPPASATLAVKMSYLYMAWRNKFTQTSTTYSLFNDAGAVVNAKATVSDDSTTFQRDEIVSGP